MQDTGNSLMRYSYRGMKFEFEVPDEVLMALMDAQTAATPEERADAAEIVAAFDAENESLLPSLYDWWRR